MKFSMLALKKMVDQYSVNEHGSIVNYLYLSIETDNK